MTSFASAALTLLLVLDPFGNIPIIMSLLRDVPQRRRRFILLRESLIALVVLLGFLFFGPFLLRLMGVQQPALTIAGAVVILIIALRMIFPHGQIVEDDLSGEPLVVPIAVPLLAGPSACATVILLGSHHTHDQQALLIVLAAWGATFVVLLLGSQFDRLLGRRGLIALERLMGMMLVVIAVQMFLDGLMPLLTQP